jgi:hypothetical protein
MTIIKNTTADMGASTIDTPNIAAHDINNNRRNQAPRPPW